MRWVVFKELRTSHNNMLQVSGDSWKHSLLQFSDLARTVWLPPSLEIWAVHGASLVQHQQPGCRAAGCCWQLFRTTAFAVSGPDPTKPACSSPVLWYKFNRAASRDQVLTPAPVAWGVDRIMASLLRVSENSHKGTNQITNQGVQMGCLTSLNVSLLGLQSAFLEYEIKAACPT